MDMEKIYDFKALSNKGAEVDFAQYKDKVIMIVNTASKCGFTPQYVGFPCDQFAHQEPGSNEEIAEFCRLNHGVTFPLMGKVEVNGANAHPVFVYLKENAQAEEAKGFKAKATALLFKAISKSVENDSDIKWNFTKFLVNRVGTVIKRFEPTTTPEAIENDIKAML